MNCGQFFLEFRYRFGLRTCLHSSLQPIKSRRSTPAGESSTAFSLLRKTLYKPGCSRVCRVVTRYQRWTGKCKRGACETLRNGRIVIRGYATWMMLFRTANRSEEHTSELQSRQYLVCRLL